MIDAGRDIDEAAEWKGAKSHAGSAASSLGDAAEDAYDAAKARISGAKDVAEREWEEAKGNLSKAGESASSAASGAWQAAKGEAADVAQNPRMGPAGRPWYLWIIGALVLALILWIIF